MAIHLVIPKTPHVLSYPMYSLIPCFIRIIKTPFFVSFPSERLANASFYVYPSPPCSIPIRQGPWVKTREKKKKKDIRWKYTS